MTRNARQTRHEDRHGKDESDERHGQHRSTPARSVRAVIERDVRRFGALILIGQGICLGFQVGGLADELGRKIRIRSGSGEFKQERGLLCEVGFAQHVEQSNVEVPTDSRVRWVVFRSWNSV